MNKEIGMYKNKLQEYAQKSGLQLPVYDTINEGAPHAPKFRSRVSVNGTMYTSTCAFPHLKQAEQHVARLALNALSKIKAQKQLQGSSMIDQDPTYCKTIIHEFAFKASFGIPKYNTVQAQVLRSVFVSSLSLGGKTYTGEMGRSKKEAEQLAARAAIHSLLGSGSSSAALLREIIHSKAKLYDALLKPNFSEINQSKLAVANPVAAEGCSQRPVTSIVPSRVNTQPLGGKSIQGGSSEKPSRHDSSKLQKRAQPSSSPIPLTSILPPHFNSGFVGTRGNSSWESKRKLDSLNVEYKKTRIRRH